MPRCCSMICSRARSIKSCICEWFRACCQRVTSSCAVPSSPTFRILTRHLGQGQSPRFLMPAILTLRKGQLSSESRDNKWHRVYSLLHIIRRVRKNAGIETSPDAVTTENDDSVFIRMQKLFIQQDIPLSMENLPIAVSHESATDRLLSYAFFCPCFEGCRQLIGIIALQCARRAYCNSRFRGTQHGCRVGISVCFFCTSSHSRMPCITATATRLRGR